MLTFNTSTGAVSVSNWGYQLQSPGGLDPVSLANQSHDLIVMDFSRDGSGANKFTVAEIDAIKDGPGGRSVAVSYISIGEASEFRDHWDPSWTSNGLASGSLTASAPSWLGPTNPDWPESRKVRYWDSDWQDVIFNGAGTGWIDEIVAQGFDAAYLDIVDAFYFWAVEATPAERAVGDPVDELDAAQRMIDFITALTNHARLSNPDFFVIPQNGEFIIDALADADPVRKAAFLDAIGGIGVEDVYNSGGLDENNPSNPDAARINVLFNDFLLNDVPVFAVDYLNTPALVTEFSLAAGSDGFLPYAASTRDLVVMDATIEETGATSVGDNLIGTPGNDIIDAGAGGDTIRGLSGNDQLTGGTSADSLFGDGGDDVLDGGQGDDVVNGGAGNDTGRYDGFGGAVIINLNLTNAQNTNAAGTDTISNIENLMGGLGNDRFTGNTAANELAGQGGADRLFGLGGDDGLDGGAGNDNLQGGNGQDILNGGDGLDTLLGGGGIDQLFGEAGNDQLRGGAGEDVLFGGAGRDVLIGGDFSGGGFPGDGATDRFSFTDVSESGPGAANRDIIRDFEQGTDIIDLSLIDAITGAGDDAFAFIGASVFSATAGELRAFATGANTVVRADVDGDGVADFDLFLNGALTLTGGDFVL